MTAPVTMMKTIFVNTLSHAKLVTAGIIFISVFSLAMALTSQLLFGLQPCILCIYQRWPYVATALLGLAGLILARKSPKKAAAIIALISAVFLGESGLAFYHVGVEQHWWKSAFEGCVISFDTDSKDLLKTITSAAAVRCDEIPWADPIFNISMAGYNAMLAFGLSVTSLLASILITRKANGL